MCPRLDCWRGLTERPGPHQHSIGERVRTSALYAGRAYLTACTALCLIALPGKVRSAPASCRLWSMVNDISHPCHARKSEPLQRRF